MPETSNTLLGFDFGLRYIGVAIGQTLTNQARPLTALLAKDGIPDWNELQHLVMTWQPNGLIVGLPFNMDGSMNHISLCARKFAHRLQAHFHLSVYCVDERLSTRAAYDYMPENRPKQKRRQQQQRERLNSIAAQIILQQWLNNPTGYSRLDDEQQTYT